MPEINTTDNIRIAKNATFLYIRMAFVMLISIYTTRVVLKALGVDDFGILNVVTGFVSLFSFLSATLSSSIQRFYNYEMGANKGANLNDIFKTSMSIQILLALCIIIICETFGVWYVNKVMVLPIERLRAANWIFQFSVISFVVNILMVPYRAAINAFERMDYFAIVSIIDVLLKLGIVIALPWIPYDKLVMYGALLLFITIINFLLYYLYCKKNFSFSKYGFELNRTFLKSILSFTGWNLVGTFAFMTKEQGINMLLNYFFGPVVNAARGVAFQVMSAIQGFTSSISVAFTPQLVKNYAEGNHDRSFKLMYTMSKMSYFCFFAFCVPIILEINTVLNLWLGSNVPEYTNIFTILVLINVLLQNFNLPVTQIMFASGDITLYQIATSCVNVLHIPLAWILLFFGYNATSVFIMTIILTILNQAVCLFVLKNKIISFSLRQYVSKVILPCLFVTIIAPIIPISFIMFFDDATIVRLFTTCIISVTSILITSYCLGFNISEQNTLKRFILKKIKH